MTVCTWCRAEMTTADSCDVDAFHRDGRRLRMVPYGRESGLPFVADRCGDCGVVRGGWHHPGCDIQQCPTCGWQLMSCGCRFDEDGEEEPDDSRIDSDAEPFGVDANGALVERTTLGGVPVVIHYADIPDSDLTSVDGIRCTTALRTVIDMAAEMDPARFPELVQDFLDRGLFTVDEAWRRLAEPDMASHRGAEMVRRVLRRMG